MESSILNITVAFEETMKRVKNYYVILIYVEEMSENNQLGCKNKFKSLSNKQVLDKNDKS